MKEVTPHCFVRIPHLDGDVVRDKVCYNGFAPRLPPHDAGENDVNNGSAGGYSPSFREVVVDARVVAQRHLQGATASGLVTGALARRGIVSHRKGGSRT